MKDFIVMSTVILMYVAAFFFYIIPSIVAWKRKHYYKWVIIALNLFFGTTGIGWLVALVCAAWPSNTPFFSLLTRDAVSKGTDQHTDKLELLERYVRLRNENVITEEELIVKKKELIG